ncbi:hypothetical protein TWF694_000183 [Orbilia ellipsospora]|uniref:Uncharacterized protein n=1 Tax=Orbilia ellipsospora TaxID=2528407 RepID=A0AAV9XNA6_9PEZI
MRNVCQVAGVTLIIPSGSTTGTTSRSSTSLIATRGSSTSSRASATRTPSTLVTSTTSRAVATGFQGLPGDELTPEDGSNIDSKFSSAAAGGIAAGIALLLVAISAYLGFKFGKRVPDVPAIPVSDDPEVVYYGGIVDNQEPGVLEERSDSGSFFLSRHS